MRYTLPMDRHTLSNGQVAAEILALGAELCSLTDATGREYLWQAGPQWPRHAPLLFPIIGELNEGRYLHRGRTYRMGRHGFARDRRFVWLETTPERCRLVLTDDAASHAIYPFAFRLEAAFLLRGATLSITYALTNTTKLYAEHDFVNSLNGPYTLDPQVSQYSTVAGMTTSLPDQTQLFDEYRIGDSVDGRSSEAAVGLRHLWKLDDGLGLTGSVQRITPLSGTVTDTSSAITIGADYTNHADVKASAQAQWQQSLASNSWLFSSGVAHKLDDSWTLLERALYSDQTDLSGGGGREIGRVQSGVAYRPVASDVWNALGQIEYTRDFDTTLGPGLALDQQAWIGAGNLNIQPTRGWELAARYAVKRELDWADGPGVPSFTQLLGARSSWDIALRWDLSAQAYRMWGDGSAQTAVGAGVGYLAWRNLWLSLGYNVLGFSAPDLAGSAYTQRGFYLHLDFKFDESVLDGSALTNRETARAVAGRQL